MTCTHRTPAKGDNRPKRPDGTLDVAAWCAQLDAAHNAGAGKPRPTREISAGYRRAMGASYAAAVNRGEFFTDATSLNRHIDDNRTLLDVLAETSCEIPNDPDPRHAELLASMLDQLGEKDLIAATRHRDEAAAMLGVQPGTINTRRVRIARRLREAAA